MTNETQTLGAAESAPAAVAVSVDTANIGAVRDMIAELKASIRG